MSYSQICLPVVTPMPTAPRIDKQHHLNVTLSRSAHQQRFRNTTAAHATARRTQRRPPSLLPQSPGASAMGTAPNLTSSSSSLSVRPPLRPHHHERIIQRQTRRYCHYWRARPVCTTAQRNTVVRAPRPSGRCLPCAHQLHDPTATASLLLAAAITVDAPCLRLRVGDLHESPC